VQKNSVSYIVDEVHAFIVDPPHDWSLSCKQAPAGEACWYHWLVGDQASVFDTTGLLMEFMHSL